MKVQRIETLYFTEEENRFLESLALFCSTHACEVCPCQQLCNYYFKDSLNLADFCDDLSVLSPRTED